MDKSRSKAVCGGGAGQAFVQPARRNLRSAREGGWGSDFEWHRDVARGSEKDIRRWGEPGLKGQWANRLINPYGLNLLYEQSLRIANPILKGGDKWNERIKAIPISVTDAGPYIPLTLETAQNRSYPLIGETYFYLNRKPGSQIDPKIREFVSYVLSREGQQAVARDGKYLPLTAAALREQRQKLHECVYLTAARASGG